MKKIFVICLMLIIGWLTADEVKLEKAPKKKEGFGGFGFGFYHQDVKELNKRLEKFGYNKIESSFGTIGGGGYGYIGNKFLIGGSGFAGIPNTSENDSAKMDISGGGGFFEVGYIVFENESFRIWPMIGIGGTGTNINIVPKITTPTFDEVLKNPKRTVDIAEGNFSLKAAINSDIVFRIKTEDENMTITGSLQLGVIYQLGSDGWMMGEGSDILDGPKFPKERLFMGFNIYFGGSEAVTENKDKSI